MFNSSNLIVKGECGTVPYRLLFKIAAASKYTTLTTTFLLYGDRDIRAGVCLHCGSQDLRSVYHAVVVGEEPLKGLLAHGDPPHMRDVSRDGISSSSGIARCSPHLLWWRLFSI